MLIDFLKYIYDFYSYMMFRVLSVINNTWINNNMYWLETHNQSCYLSILSTEILNSAESGSTIQIFKAEFDEMNKIKW